jgi:hypothetical protein
MTDLICFNHPHDSKPVKNELIDGFFISHTVIQENMIFRNRQLNNIIQSNLGASNSDGSNTMDGSIWFESLVNFPYISK